MPPIIVWASRPRNSAWQLASVTIHKPWRERERKFFELLTILCAFVAVLGVISAVRQVQMGDVRAGPERVSYIIGLFLFPLIFLIVALVLYQKRVPRNPS
jgi:hypothetical protein